MTESQSKRALDLGGELSSLQEIRRRILAQIEQVIVGQDEVIEQLMIALFSGGHCLLVGPSGLAKTFIVRALADSLDLSFKRIQFTPDFMPSDITGWDLLQEDQATGKREFKFSRGPLFANIILADEINRATPRTQAALLEAMEERKVTCGGKDYFLEPPFHVLATQNPRDQEGTYALPEAQLDRFLFQIHVDYPDMEEEIQIMQTVAARRDVVITPVIHRLELMQAQRLVAKIPVPGELYRYAARLVRATRIGEAEADKHAREYLSCGAGPRASLGLISATQARVALLGRAVPTVDDVRAVVPPVFRHRIITNFNAEAEGVTPDMVISRLLENLR
jgi:MoxR-like ATPase